MIIHEVFEALANICKNASRDEIFKCLTAAKTEAMNMSNFELAAAFRELTVSLTNVPKTTQPDEPKKGEQGS